MADLKQLGADLKRIDRMIVDLVHRRMGIARLVGYEKMRTQQPMFRSEIEDQRLEEIAEYALSVGVNPNMARSVLYSLINESCKQQMILFQNSDASNLEVLEGKERADKLRSNLLHLTEAIAPKYDEVFYGNDFFSRVFTSYEKYRLMTFVETLTDRELALDLGCGTGHASFLLCAKFQSVVGFDISQHMQYHATLNAERSGVENIDFICHDVEAGLPFEDDSVSFVNMNYGAASDFMDFPCLLEEVRRVLKPGGGVFLSFYNMDSISQKFGFLPWKTDKSSTLNPYTNCLEVNVGGQQVSVHAKPYTIKEVRELLEPSFNLGRSSSYPFLCSILPSEVLEGLDNFNDLVRLECEVGASDEVYSGSYLICETTKRA